MTTRCESNIALVYHLTGILGEFLIGDAMDNVTGTGVISSGFICLFCHKWDNFFI